MRFTTQEIINIGKVCANLAFTDSQRAVHSGDFYDHELPLLITITTKSVEWQFLKSPNDETLFNTGDYLLSICGGYVNKAAELLGLAINSSSIMYKYTELPIDYSGVASNEYTNISLIGATDLMFVLVDAVPVTDFTFDNTIGKIVFNTIQLIPEDIPNGVPSTKLLIIFNKKIN